LWSRQRRDYVFIQAFDELHQADVREIHLGPRRPARQNAVVPIQRRREEFVEQRCFANAGLALDKQGSGLGNLVRQERIERTAFVDSADNRVRQWWPHLPRVTSRIVSRARVGDTKRARIGRAAFIRPDPPWRRFAR
jgi:hypothetical protein